ncbi:cellulose synthase catalytic subunit [Micromonospora soli]|uniref:glycosyltransferase family 2 protein n=1 Tax=Micromonospora sp. NBRC 110009 TaxID=3061627 RepID=UPI002670DBF7|nr:cellulose synthase catalytic subunit [Micromonospora sp. NBRC 110009]WKT96973.1 cellulose synthase catalytic subunit [Micromonospora sp. NBRC 110009]
MLFLAFAGVMYGMTRMAIQTWWTSPLFVIIAVQIGGVAISLLSSTRKRRSNLAEHRARIAAYRPARYPSVDVFLPTAGEDLQILANTYQHVSRLRWPGVMTVYVLDDSDRLAVRELAERHGFRYLVRPNRPIMKKAGNLAYGFAYSNGELIHVFDADFAPREDMTLEIAPYFEDPKIGIVQTPQYFDVKHPDFNWLQRAAGATQELFYRWIQPARDAVDAAICVGTNAIYRRAALMAGGGFAQIGHSEDVHTGVNMAKAGYVTRYVPVNLAKGVCPDDFDGFAPQQYRWCTGSMSLLGDPRFHRSPLTVKQKLCFWTGFLYYITTSLAVFTVPIPGLLMAWFFPQYIKPANYLPLVGAVVVWAFMMPVVTHGRWTPAVVRIQLLIGFCHTVALFDFLRERTAAWVPTGAAKGAPIAKRVFRLLRTWLLTVHLLLWLGLALGAATYGIDRYWASILLTLPSMYFTVPLLLGNAGLRRRRPLPAPGRSAVALGRNKPTRQPQPATPVRVKA